MKMIIHIGYDMVSIKDCDPMTQQQLNELAMKFVREVSAQMKSDVFMIENAVANVRIDEESEADTLTGTPHIC